MIVRFLGFLVLAGVLAACEPQQPGTSTAPGAPTARELADTNAVRFRQLDAVNALRQGRGLQPLNYNNALNSAALTHARDMALQQRAWHFGTDRSNPQSRAARAGFSGLVLGENIAEAFEGDIVTLQNWLDQSSSANLILSREATDFGFAWFREDNGKIWWVQLVARGA